MYSVMYCARFTHVADDRILDQLMRILRFMVVHKNRGLPFSPHKEDWHGFDKHQLYAYADASWADDVIEYRSTFGYFVFLNGCPIAMRSKLSPCVLKSSGHAEYYAANMCCEEVQLYRELLENMGFIQHGPTILHEDNQTCIAIIKGVSSAGNNKFVAQRYHAIRDLYRLGIIFPVYVPTNEQKADMLTKALGPTKFWEQTNDVMIYDDVG
jgi:hypothetical protein